MPKIRIEYEVPEGDCLNCEHSGYTFDCVLFKAYFLERDKQGRWLRCQPCIDAEVKVQPE